MQKIAIVGFGNNVSKNVLPAIKRSGNIEVESIYVREPDKYTTKAIEYGVSLRKISDNISPSVAWVYISTPISTHYELIKKFLLDGRNVICEKPLTASLWEAKELFDLAEKQNCRLHEVAMYQFHKQFQHLRNTLSENDNSIKSISVKFSIPHLDKDDIRYKRELNGGALLDVGYYPLSILISCFGMPSEIVKTIYSQPGYEVDLFGNAVFKYEHFYCIAEWGIGLPYSNEITIVTDRKIIKYDRIFSKPPTYSTNMHIKEGFNSFDVEIGSDDQFLNMFENILGPSGASLETHERVLQLLDIMNRS